MPDECVPLLGEEFHLFQTRIATSLHDELEIVRRRNSAITVKHLIRGESVTTSIISQWPGAFLDVLQIGPYSEKMIQRIRKERRGITVNRLCRAFLKK